MSLNWVMLAAGGGFTPLPGEEKLYQSENRTTLSLSTGNQFPANAFSISSSQGTAYLTTHRVVYLPHTPTPQLQSFAVTLLDCLDGRITSPLFGPNSFEAAVKPAANGGIPSQIPGVQLKMTFKSGGAYDFFQKFSAMKERLSDLAQMGDGATRPGRNGAGCVNSNSLHLDPLPAYEERNQGPQVAAQATETSAAVPTPQPTAAQPADVPASSAGQSTPDEPPPGYEEVQRISVMESLDRDLRIGDTATSSRP